MANEAKFWILANEAAKELGWLPETIFTQWQWETGHFSSANLNNNNNIAGQTYYQGCGYPRGTARPEKEGGYYIQYPDAAAGYVDFIKKNIRRYANVATGHTPEAQFDLIAKDGWAADPHYAAGLKSLHQANIRDGIYKLPREDAKPKNGWVKENSIWYYYDAGKKRIGWLQDGGKWFYLREVTGQMVTGWYKVAGTWYYFDTHGSMQTGWITYKGKKYYLDTEGKMLIGTQAIDGKTYVFASNGALIQ